jgi:purine-binding chemotaxis protein CheW
MISTRKTVHWSESHERLAAIERRIAQSWSPDAEECARVLEARALVLAREPVQRKATAKRLDVVEFLLAQERYGIATSCVREVLPLVELTPLPGVPPFVLGITNVRGQIVSVLDLKRFFDLPEKGLINQNQLIVVRSGEMELGILADEVLGVTSIDLEELQPPLPTMTGIRAEYLRGLTAERLAVLEIEKILADRRIVVEKVR